jgi:hypothetical protein
MIGTADSTYVLVSGVGDKVRAITRIADESNEDYLLMIAVRTPDEV